MTADPLEQTELFPPPPAKLTDRQAFAWQLVRDARPGEEPTADEIGAALHERAGKHDRGDRCTYCTMEGRSVLTSKALRALVKRKRGYGRGSAYVPRAARVAESAQTDEFPEGF